MVESPEKEIYDAHNQRNLKHINKAREAFQGKHASLLLSILHYYYFY